MEIGRLNSVQHAGFAPPQGGARAQPRPVAIVVAAPVAATLPPPARGDAACLTLLMAQTYGFKVASAARTNAYGQTVVLEPIFSLTA